MTVSLLEYLRRGFASLEGVTKDEFDSLQEQIKTLLFSGGQENTEDAVKLAAMAAYYYGLAGTKVSQLVSIKTAIERQRDARRLQVSQMDNIPLSKKADLERRLLLDEESQVLRREFDEVSAMILYFQNMRETLYMNHYFLRKESGAQGGRYNRINHGDQ